MSVSGTLIAQELRHSKGALATCKYILERSQMPDAAFQVRAMSPNRLAGLALTARGDLLQYTVVTIHLPPVLCLPGCDDTPRRVDLGMVRAPSRSQPHHVSHFRGRAGCFAPRAAAVCCDGCLRGQASALASPSRRQPRRAASAREARRTGDTTVRRAPPRPLCLRSRLQPEERAALRAFCVQYAICRQPPPPSFVRSQARAPFAARPLPSLGSTANRANQLTGSPSPPSLAGHGACRAAPQARLGRGVPRAAGRVLRAGERAARPPPPGTRPNPPPRALVCRPELTSPLPRPCPSAD